MQDCPVEGGECLEWAHRYLMDCVCNFRDEVSLALGLVSVFSWGVAEVPQIVTNFKEQNTEGVSLAFLMTWVVGDVFNLVGCYLEPATLPTQFYMALMYTFTTIVLVGQTIYYGHLRSHFHRADLLKDEATSAAKEEEEAQQQTKLDVEAQKNPLHVKRADSSSPELSSSIINVPHGQHRGSRDLYYTSARSLASSHTPIVGSYLVGSRESGSHTQSFLTPASTQGSAAAQEHAIPSNGSASPQGYSPASSNSAGGGSVLGRSATAAAASVLILGTVGLSSTFLSGGSFGRVAQQAGGRILRRAAGRSLLLSLGSGASRIPHYFREAAETNGLWGEVFGWVMAAIYMGGRLPQILLNIKRGSVEGLNPLMFIFALVGNVTYVSSILVRTLDWAMIKPNMPWLVDAGVCVGLDCFIIGQFLYYEYSGGPVQGEVGSEHEDDKNGSYELVR